MKKHRRTTVKGRHRKPSANARPGLMTAAAGGVLYAALSVSGASAAELTDEPSVSAEDFYSSDSYEADTGAYAEYTQGTGADSGGEPGTYTGESSVNGEALSDQAQPEPEAASGYAGESYQADTGAYAEYTQGTGADSGGEPSTYTGESSVNEEVLSGEAQPGGEEQPRAGLEVDEASLFGPGAQAEPGMGSAESGVSLVDEVDGIPGMQIRQDDGARPGAEAGNGQLVTDEQPQPADGQESSADTQQSGSDQQPGVDQQPGRGQQPAAEDEGIAAGDVIRQDLVEGKAGACTAGVAATDGESNFVLTAGHCKSERNGTDPGWFTADGKTIGHTERREFPGADFSVVRSETDLNPEEFKEVGEAHVDEDVCQRGATTFRETGVRDNCGKVTAVNDSFTFTNHDKEGNISHDTVNDLIATDIPTRDGDSGGLLFDKNTKQALGLLSGQGRFFPLSKVLEQNPDLRLGVAPKSAS